jgi:hypothetical protein
MSILLYSTVQYSTINHSCHGLGDTNRRFLDGQQLLVIPQIKGDAETVAGSTVPQATLRLSDLRAEVGQFSDSISR